MKLLPKFEMQRATISAPDYEAEGSVLIMRWLGLVIEIAVMSERPAPMTMSIEEWIDEA